MNEWRTKPSKRRTDKRTGQADKVEWTEVNIYIELKGPMITQVNHNLKYISVLIDDHDAQHQQTIV